MLERITSIADTDLNNQQAVRAGVLALEEMLLPGSAPELTLGSDILKRLQKVYERFETDLEYEFAQKFLEGEVSIEDYPLYRRFSRLVQAEVDLASITESDRVLFIGSGPLPISPILISQLTPARVDCFDKSSEAVLVSEKVIEQLGLNERIRIFNVGGDTRRIHGYNVVVVALLAQPKSDILYNVQWSIPEGTRVICRTSEGVRQAFYEPTNPATYGFIGRYQFVGKHSAGIDDTISSLLFQISGSRQNR